MRAIRDQVKRDYRREANRGVKPARFAVFFVANHGDIPALAMGTVAKRNGVLHADRYGRYRAVFQTRDAAGKARLKQAPTFFEDGVLLVIDRTNGRTVKTFTFNGLARAKALYDNDSRIGTGGSIKPPGGRKFAKRGFDAARGDGREGFSIHSKRHPSKFNDNRMQFG